MAGRGRGLDLFRKLAAMQMEETEQEDEEEGAAAGASLQPTESDLSLLQTQSEAHRKFQQVEDYNRARFANSETADDDASIGTESFIAPHKRYIAKVRGEETSLSSPTETEASDKKFIFPLGRGRGMFTVGKPQVDLASTSDSDKAAGDTLEKPNIGTIPKSGGRGRGMIFSSGRGSSDPVKDKSQGETPKSDSDVKVEVVVEEQKPTPSQAPKEVILKHGKKGTSYPALTNSIILECNSDFGMFEYDVRLKPPLDALRSRHKCLNLIADLIGTIRNYDGGETLYLPFKLPSSTVSRTVNDKENLIENVQIFITFRRKRSLDECLHFYNVLFERIMVKLNYERVGRKYFDPHQPKMVPQHKLAVWPGYVKAVDELEGGLMLTLDVSHRVLNQRTVYDFIDDCIQQSKKGGGNWQDNFRKGVIGCIVSTKYNNKTYRVDDIDWNQTPNSTWKNKEGVEQSYADYYNKQYGINVKDKKQPILVSRKEQRVSGRAEKLEIMFGLIPELCQMTGLTDEMRSNFTVMKDLAQHTKLSPLQRIGSYKKFIDRVNENANAKQLLDDWGLKLQTDPVKCTARLLDGEKIIFGNTKSYDIGPNADFNRQITSNTVLEAYDLTNWILIFDKRDKTAAESLESFIHKSGPPSGIRTSKARRIELPNDRVDTYVSTIRENLTNDKSIQFVVIIFPTLRDDRYAAVKRVLCSDLACPSQCVNAKTLRNETKNRSIVQKILLQMNCKLGGSLWGINIPLKNTMIIGIDTYHGKTNEKNVKSVGGLVASVNESFTRYFSKPHIQGPKEELLSGLTACLIDALHCYKNFNDQKLPERLIIYRDGVGDGMLEQVRQIEIRQFEQACARVDPNYAPKIVFVVVQKQVNTKFFKMLNSMKDGKQEIVNPPPGSVLDNTITRQHFYDFYLCAQHVREGTTTPSHYVVLRDDCNWEPDILQKLTYKLTYMYYNWPGAVRVPAPCQYAHKLVELIGAAVQRQPHAKLSDKLFFL